jgi:ATP-dependent Zn protease
MYMQYFKIFYVFVLYNLLASVECLHASQLRKSSCLVKKAFLPQAKQMHTNALYGRMSYFSSQIAHLDKPSTVDVPLLVSITRKQSDSQFNEFVRKGCVRGQDKQVKTISTDTFHESLDETMVGPLFKGIYFNDATKREFAFHESGHALVGTKLMANNLVTKLSIKPRSLEDSLIGKSVRRKAGEATIAGGHYLSHSLSDEDDVTIDAAINLVAVYFGGGIAQDILHKRFNNNLTDLLSMPELGGDIPQAYATAQKIYEAKVQHNLLPKPYSNIELQEAMAKDRMIVFKQAHDRAKQVLLPNQDSLISLGTALAKQEDLFAPQYYDIVKTPQPEYKFK